MKKCTLLFAVMLAVTFSQAQIALEHSFKFNLRTPYEIIDLNGYTLGNLFAYRDENGALVCIDAITYDEIARVTISGMNSYDMIAKNIYSTDGLIGFIATDGGNKDGGHAYVYNQNGIMLADLGGDVEFIKIIQIASAYKLIVYRYGEYKEIVDGQEIWTSKYQTDVYSLPGNGTSTDVNNVPAKQFAKPYPNPTHGTINLPYELSSTTGQMQIFDINGRLMETRLISRQQDVLELNTTNYPAGMYFYQVEGTSQSFIVE